MVQFVYLGDSNWFYRDRTYEQFPWHLMYTPEDVATFTSGHLTPGMPCYAYPIYELDMSWDNQTRFRSLIQAVSAHAEPLYLMLWIGQNTAWDLACSQHAHADIQKCYDLASKRVHQFVDTLLTTGSFKRIYIIDYHDHTTMVANKLYQQLNQHIIHELQARLPCSIRVPMIDTTADMYTDGTHLSRQYQQIVAKHIADFVQASIRPQLES